MEPRRTGIVEYLAKEPGKEMEELVEKTTTE